MFNYRGYLGSSSYSEEDGVFYGKVEGISDLVSYESNSQDDIEEEFRSAVDDYLEFRMEIEKSY